MPCINLPTIDFSPPGLSLLLPDIVIPIPTPGLSLCCDISITRPPIPPIILPLGPIPGIAVILQPLIAAIQLIIKTLNLILSQIPTACPLE